MKPDGDLTSVAADAGISHPPSKVVIEILFSAIAAQAANGDIRAAGICMDVRVAPPGSQHMSDAICVQLEHEDGEAVDVFLPYAVNSTGAVTYGDLFASPGERRIFLPSAG